MVIHNHSALAVKVRDLKRAGLTDKQIAAQLNLSKNQVHYIRAKYSIGGRYELYAAAIAADLRAELQS